MTEQNYVHTGRDVLGMYADSGYTVSEITIDHPVLGAEPTRNEVTIELTLQEPVSSVLDRMEADLEGGVQASGSGDRLESEYDDHTDED